VSGHASVFQASSYRDTRTSTLGPRGPLEERIPLGSPTDGPLLFHTHTRALALGLGRRSSTTQPKNTKGHCVVVGGGRKRRSRRARRRRRWRRIAGGRFEFLPHDDDLLLLLVHADRRTSVVVRRATHWRLGKIRRFFLHHVVGDLRRRCVVLVFDRHHRGGGLGVLGRRSGLHHVEEGTKGSGRDVRGIKGKRHGSRAWKMAEGAKKGKDTGAVKSKHLLLFDTNGQRVSTTRHFYVCHRLSRVSNVRLTQK
jgi:hypothetical protein